MPEPDTIGISIVDCGMRAISARINMFRPSGGTWYLGPNAVIAARESGSCEADGVVFEDDPTAGQGADNPARPLVLTNRPSDDGDGA